MFARLSDYIRELSFAKPNSNDTRQEVSQHFLRAQVFVNYRNQFFKLLLVWRLIYCCHQETKWAIKRKIQTPSSKKKK